MEDIEKLSADERTELLKRKSDRPSQNPMGTIYPQRIKELLASTDLSRPVFKEHEPRKIYRVNTKAMFHLTKCPVCGNRMGKRLDEKFFKTRGKCFDCIIEEEHKIRLSGNWEEYEKWKLMENQLAWLKDTRDETEDYLSNNLKQKFEYVKEDGSIEKWNNATYERDKIFISDKLIEIKKIIEKLEQDVIPLREKFDYNDPLKNINA